jgi:hypothetical protein
MSHPLEHVAAQVQFHNWRRRAEHDWDFEAERLQSPPMPSERRQVGQAMLAMSAMIAASVFAFAQ